jgi:hypothetical protein
MNMKKVDSKVAVLTSKLSYTDVDNVSHILPSGTEVTVCVERGIAFDGLNHFEIFPFQYQVEVQYAC